jgi:MFS family permease
MTATRFSCRRPPFERRENVKRIITTVLAVVGVVISLASFLTFVVLGSRPDTHTGLMQMLLGWASTGLIAGIVIALIGGLLGDLLKEQRSEIMTIKERSARFFGTDGERVNDLTVMEEGPTPTDLPIHDTDVLSIMDDFMG